MVNYQALVSTLENLQRSTFNEDKKVKSNFFLTCRLHLCHSVINQHTVFIRIVAAATINFSFARVRLLFECSYYSRATLNRGWLLLTSS